MSTVSLQYVGIKDQHDDILYGTGLWGKGAIRKVDLAIAPFMLHHDDVWKDGRPLAARKKDPITPQKRPPVIRPDERDTNAVAVNIANMDARGLVAFAKNTFNRELDATQKPDVLRAEVRYLMRMAP